MVQLTESVGWWMGDDDFHRVEISIAGGVWKMVHDPAPKRFVFFSFFFYIMYSLLRYKNSHAALAMA